MDVTHIFKAAVLAVKLQRKTETSTNTNDQGMSPLSCSVTAVKEQKRRTKNQNLIKRDEYSRQAREICHNITTLRNFLLENRAAYMRIGQHLKSSLRMTDEQRDLIDRESEKFFIYYKQYLAQLRGDWKKAKRKPQQQAHMNAVLDLLVNYLHDIQNLFLQQKRYRVQYELDTYRMIKLAADKNSIPARPGGSSFTRPKNLNGLSSGAESTDSDVNEKSVLLDKRSSVQSQDQSYETQKLRHRFKHKSEIAERNLKYDKQGNQNDQASQRPVITQVALYEDMPQEAENDQDVLSEEDVQLFQQENEVLFQELQGLSQEIEAIEKNVVEISQLQDIFTEKVSVQQNNIERIANAVVGATENVKDANDQIRRAIQRNAGLRVYSLFFLIVMSFALLFLDWYNE